MHEDNNVKAGRDSADFITLDKGALIPCLEITDLTLEGSGLARIDGRVVFLDGGLPGAKVSARVTEVKKKFCHAEVVEVIEHSPDEAEPFCPHFDLCGGCSLQNYSYPAALSWKGKQLGQTLSRIGRVPESGLPPLPAASPRLRAFRNKMSYAFGHDEQGNPALGLRKRGGRTVFDVTGCGIQDNAAMHILQKVREFSARHSIPHWDGRQGYLRHLIIHTPDLAQNGRKVIMLELITAPHPSSRAFSSLWSEFAKSVVGPDKSGAPFPIIIGSAHWERKSRAELAEGERLLGVVGKKTFFESFGDQILEVPCNSFLQTNTGTAALLYEKAASLANLSGTESVWDLYCGIGAVSFQLAGNASSILGIDSNRESIRAARKNSASLGFANCAFEAGDVAELVKKRLGEPHPDLIILDPPRNGLCEELTSILKKLTTSRILYISCDPATQARDISRLSPEWAVQSSFAFDMFPHTTHLENIVLLQRVSG